MKNPRLRLIPVLFCLASCGSLHAADLAYEPFDYAASQALTASNGLSNGGTGWAASWYDDGQAIAVSTRAQGLAFTDSAGNILHVSGRAADTAGATTTRSFRKITTTTSGDVWISFLWSLAAQNSKFEGVTFYRGTQACFAVSNPSTYTTTASIVLGNNLANTSASSSKGAFGTTHLVVLRLAKGAGTGGGDLVQLFVDPAMTGVPTIPDASTSGTNFNFDTIRLAGQDGASFAFDEFRVGTTFASVTPHDTAPNGGVDSDGDGLSDAEEILLGTDPNVSNAGLFTAIRNNPGFFGLFNASGILQQGEGGVVIQKVGNSPVPFSFEIQQSENLRTWPQVETVTRSVTLPDGKSFLRVTLEK